MLTSMVETDGQATGRTHRPTNASDENSPPVKETEGWTRAALNVEIPSATKISLWHNMVVLWNSHTVKQSMWWFFFIEIKHYSRRGPITLWLYVLLEHWCRDCETVPEQHWNKWGTVSQSQCTLPQCKQISFGIKNESEVQGHSSPELTGILTVLKCICGPDLEILTWITGE